MRSEHPLDKAQQGFNNVGCNQPYAGNLATAFERQKNSWVSASQWMYVYF